MTVDYRRVGRRLLPMLGAGYLLLSMFLGATLTVAHFALPMDLGSFLASGQLAAAGQNPYSYEHELIFRVPVPQLDREIPSPNLNPPISVAIFHALANTGIAIFPVVIGWKAISALFYSAVAYLLSRRYPASAHLVVYAWLFSLAGFWQTIEVGQIYMPLLLLAIGAWTSLENGDERRAGVLLGLLIAFKPQFALWPVLLFLLGRRVTLLASAATAVAVSTVPLAIYGPSIYIQWLQATSEYAGLLLPGNMSISSLLARAAPEPIGVAASLISAFLLLLIATRKRLDQMQASLVAILAVLLVSPYSWSGYSLFLLPAFLSRPRWTWPIKLAAGLLAVPLLFVMEAIAAPALSFALFGWLYGWAIVILLWDTLAPGRPSGGPESAPATLIVEEPPRSSR